MLSPAHNGAEDRHATNHEDTNSEEDRITLAPRSLKLQVGLNHSHFSRTVAPAIRASNSGVQPSPSVMGASIWSGNDRR